MHNRLHSADWRSLLDGRPCAPRTDPVVREYTEGLTTGDQFTSEIAEAFAAGYDAARTAVSGKIPKEPA